MYRLLIAALVALGLLGAFTLRQEAAPAPGPVDTYVPWLRLWQSTAPVVGLPCAAPVVVPVGVNYVQTGEGKYKLQYMTDNDQGTLCLRNGQGVIACAPTCNSSPCTFYAPAWADHHDVLSWTITGEGPPACYYATTVWDVQGSIGP